jgi:hypothetical protein
LNETIYVKFSPDLTGGFSGSIPINFDCSTTYVPVSGTGVNAAVISIFTDSAIVSSTHSASLTGQVTNIGCNTLTAYGFVYGSDSTALNTQVTSANMNINNFSVSLNGLLQNTTYYYKSFAISNDSTVYGSEHSFTTLTIPEKLTVYPNPVQHAAVLHYSINNITNGSYEVQIYNSVGQLVFNKQVIAVGFIDNSFTLPAALSCGLYDLQIVRQGFTAEKTFIIY